MIKIYTIYNYLFISFFIIIIIYILCENVYQIS